MSIDNNYYQYIIRRFKLWARFYDWTWVLINYLRPQLINFSGRPTREQILDVCTGTGAVALGLAKLNNSVSAIDLSPEMIEIARKKDSAKQINWQVQNSTQLKFPTASFDLITISFGLHEMPVALAQATLTQCARLLKPGGKIVVMDFHRGQSLLFKIGCPFLKLYECRYYPKFIAVDFSQIAVAAGLSITRQQKTLFDLAALWELQIK